MKSVLLVATFLISSAALAGSVENKIKEIENQNNARCENRKTSSSFCLGPDYYSQVCFYSVKYNCLSQEGDFTVKIKVKSSYNFDLEKRVEKIRKVKIQK